MFARVKNYFAGARQEFKAIHWPTFAETRRLTLVVVGLSLLVAVFLGVFDFVFTFVLSKLFV